MNYLIVTGNPIDGLGLIGPFPDFDTAENEAHEMLPNDAEFWITEITPVIRNLSLDPDLLDVLYQYTPAHIVEQLLEQAPHIG